MFWTDIARFLQYFRNLSNSFINIFAILQDFNGIFSKYSFNITVLCGDITGYKLGFMMQKFKNLDEIQHTEIFAVVKFWSGKITEFLRQCYVILFDSI